MFDGGSVDNYIGSNVVEELELLNTSQEITNQCLMIISFPRSTILCHIINMIANNSFYGPSQSWEIL